MSNFRSRSVKVDHFAMIPRADIPRSRFQIETSHKTTFDAGYLIPIFVDEVLPGDSFSLKMTAFARMATPIFPIMDNLYLDTFFFFVPNRLCWDNWQRFMGEQPNPGNSIDFIIPTITTTSEEVPDVGSIQDYFGLPTQGQGSGVYTYNALPFRAYNLIWNEWFRDQNLQASVPTPTGDTDGPSNYTLLRRGKRHDYFTSALPFVQKGEAAVIPIGGQATVFRNEASPTPSFVVPASSAPGTQRTMIAGYTDQNDMALTGANIPGPGSSFPIQWGNQTGLIADLTDATAVTINALRQSFQIQKLLERDARGGTRYTEIIRSHFGVISPDARLQRPEYLGGGSTMVNINPIAQTTSQDNPLATLAAIGTATASGHGFSQSFTEHGYIIGLASVRADLTYQQGIRKMWNRSTRYDFYFPVFANLGEQAVLNREIYYKGDASDENVFGYQERWAEYRYHPSRITGLFKSYNATPIDGWHLAQFFADTPTLSADFIQENPPMPRVLAVGEEANGQQFIFDSIFSIGATRAMPMYSVPGLVDHF
nr:MAG: major capsid protein [Microvirus sp.]